eukprot:1186325-Prorocentrum_minimum.AAC.2
MFTNATVGGQASAAEPSNTLGLSIGIYPAAGPEWTGRSPSIGIYPVGMDRSQPLDRNIPRCRTSCSISIGIYRATTLSLTRPDPDP